MMATAAISGKVTGVSQVLQNLKRLENKAMRESELGVAVGFGGSSAPYALYVHENLNARHHPPHGNGGEAKFLETPSRTRRKEMMQIILSALKAGKTMSQALFYAGSALLGWARELCPWKTGALRDSGFVKVGPK